jgi:hypothetical protein
MIGINNLTAILDSSDEYLESERIYESAYRVGVKMLGERDSDTLTSCSGWGKFYSSLESTKKPKTCIYKPPRPGPLLLGLTALILSPVLVTTPQPSIAKDLTIGSRSEVDSY